MSLESSKRPNESHDVDNDALSQRKRIRTGRDEERPLKRRLSSSPNGQQLKIQHITNGTSRPPIIPLMPSQRLDLFKKRQRWRQSNFYNSRNYRVRSSNSSLRSSREPSVEVESLVSIKSKLFHGNYVEASTQTDSIPSLKSKITETSKPLRLEQNAKLGVFSGEILYDSDELNEGKNISPVKFPESKPTRNRAVPVSSSTLSALTNDKKRFTQIEKPTPAEESTKGEEPVESQFKEVAVGPSAGFNFLSSKNENVEELDQNNIQQTSSTKKSESINEPIPSFSLGTDKTHSKDSQAANSTFSFGGKISEIKETSTPAFSLSSKVEDKETSKPPAFSFGSKPDEKKDIPAPSFFGSKPLNGFAFAAKPSETAKVEELRPAHPLNSKASDASSLFSQEKVQGESKPGFSFNEASKRDEPGFNFGAKAPTESKETQDKDSGHKGTFVFGSSSNTEKPAPEVGGLFNKDKATTGFSFGGKVDDKNSTIPSFSFGSNSKNDDKQEGLAKGSDSAPKPAFSLGEKTTNAGKTAFSFGGKPDSDKDLSKPTLLNGSLGDEKKSEPKLPSFGNFDQEQKKKPILGSESSDFKSSFNFGQSAPPALAKGSTEPEAGNSFKPTGFNFGAPTTSSGKKDEPLAKKPAFSFGETKKPELAPQHSLPNPVTGKPSFNFGGVASTGANDNKSLFGSTTTAKPAKPLGFNFGQTTKPELKTDTSQPSANTKQSSSVFNFGSGGLTPTPSAVFGQAPSAAQASSTPFSFGATTKPAFGANAQQQSTTTSAFGGSNTQPQQSTSAFGNGVNVFGGDTPAAAKPSFATGNSVNFNFGAQNVPSSSTPAAIFGGQSTNNAFGSQQPSASFGFGASQPPGFGAPAGSTPFGTPTQAIPAQGTPGMATPSQQQSRVPGRKMAQMRSRRR